MAKARRVAKAKPSKKRHEAAADEENDGEDGDDTIAPKEKFVLTRAGMALFGEPPDEDSQDLDEMADAEARGLMVRYLSVVAGEVWTPEQVRQKLHELRVRDEEEELTEAVELARQQKLTLRELYEKPPPIWFHPAFAAEVGDAFIAGTAFESGSLSVSLEVMLLTLRRMQADDGVATKSLSHATLEALNSATDALDACCNLVYKKKHRLSDIYLRKVVGDIGALDPGELLLIPVEIRGTYRLLVVRRNVTPDEDTCSVTIVASGDYHDLRYHQSAAAPPKVRYRTSLELHGVPFERLCDEALWVSLSYAEKGSCRLYKGDDILYSVFVPYATERSLDHAMLHAHAECARKGVEDAPMRSTRRTRHDYGVLRSALHYLLTRVHGVIASDAKYVSTLMRLQTLKFARNDLMFVGSLGEAERTILTLAGRQLAYKAARQAERFPTTLSADAMASMRVQLEELGSLVARIPGSGRTPPPPPLTLSQLEVELFGMTLAERLGGTYILGSPKNPEHPLQLAPDELLERVDVLGVYFLRELVRAVPQDHPDARERVRAAPRQEEAAVRDPNRLVRRG